MLKRLNSNFTTALCTGCALIAFAFFQNRINVSSATLDVAAAIICLTPVLLAPVWRKSCQKKTATR